MDVGGRPGVPTGTRLVDTMRPSTRADASNASVGERGAEREVKREMQKEIRVELQQKQARAAQPSGPEPSPSEAGGWRPRLEAGAGGRGWRPGLEAEAGGRASELPASAAEVFLAFACLPPHAQPVQPLPTLTPPPLTLSRALAPRPPLTLECDSAHACT